MIASFFGSMCIAGAGIWFKLTLDRISAQQRDYNSARNKCTRAHCLDCDVHQNVPEVQVRVAALMSENQRLTDENHRLAQDQATLLATIDPKPYR